MIGNSRSNMSNIKSEETRPFADQSCPSSSIVKLEYVAPPRPPTAAFSCEYCGNEFNLKEHLIRHVIELHGDTCTPVKPESSSIQPVSSESIPHSLHENSYSSSINADITESNSSVSLPQRLKGNSVEKVQNSYMSQECFTEKKIHNKHMIVHSNSKLFSCDICQKSFSQEENLNVHRLIHSAGKAYSCEVCQRSFSEEENLKRHVLIHSGDKPFSCEVCQKDFRYKSNLNRHLLIHSGVKPYSCEVCQKSFSQKSSLNTHLLIHSDSKQYNCEVCQK
eukprot:803613_1